MGSDKGVLLAALKSSGAPSVKQPIICGALAMDSDISKVRIFYVIVSWSYFPFGSKVVARMEIDSVVSMCFHGKASWPGTYPKGLLHWKVTWCAHLH